MRTESNAPALERGLQIIEYLASNEAPVAFNDFVTELSIPKATLARLLPILVEHGYIKKQDSNGLYTLAARANLFCEITSVPERLLHKGKKLLKEICDQTQNTVVLFYWNGYETQVLHKELHPESIVMQPIGNISRDYINPPWGWILLENSNAELDQKTLDFKESETFKNAMKWYKKYGFVYDNENRTTRRLGVPILMDDEIVGTLGLGGNSLTIEDDQVMKFGQLLKDYAKQLCN